MRLPEPSRIPRPETFVRSAGQLSLWNSESDAANAHAWVAVSMAKRSDQSYSTIVAIRGGFSS